MMDDPWDVKSVRQLGQYTSCMKLNGVPLLPPVLSKECRKEMQYYKLLAKEVEKRISILQPYVNCDTDTSEEQTDIPEIPECELQNKFGKENMSADLDPSFEKKSFMKESSRLDETLTSSPSHTELCNLSSKRLAVDTTDTYSPPFSVDFSLDISETVRNTEIIKTRSPSPVEIPERDYNCLDAQEVDTDCNIGTKNVKYKQLKDKIIEDIINFSVTVATDKFPDKFLPKDVMPSLSCKSFTGSLNNIYEDSDKNKPNLVRQRSYTVLNPSPQLLAHLELQSFNLGVEVSCISMSDSTSNVSSTPTKKRRSWDLESAKVKWSNMAQELKQKKLPNPSNATNRSRAKGQTPKRAGSPPVTKFAHVDKTRCPKPVAKSEPVQKTRKSSPVKNIPPNKTFTVEEPVTTMTVTTSKSKCIRETTSPKTLNLKRESHESISQKPSNCKKDPPSSQMISNSNNHTVKVREVSATPKLLLISESEDPATKVKELYEKIQKQQQIQMISLVEKQKREQQLLQQVFEEQNNLLFKQLKTICPKSPEEVKEAWIDKTQEADRGPVSLSQLIKPKSPEQSSLSTRAPSTFIDSTLNSYLKHCDSVLKNSRDITGSIKKLGRSDIQNGTAHSPSTHPECSHTRTISPSHRNSPTARRLNYDTSVSTHRDNELILTDRTNDTMADVNVTFSSDTEESRSYNSNRRSERPSCQEVTPALPVTPRNSSRSTDSAIKSMEQTIQNSIDSCSARRCKPVVKHQPTPKMQAAATKIVAHVRGYLVRRLMRTARVQGTVQTIKDALLCALQLHQDREGIRGADVDLHRRLIQQITAACYCLHDTFIASSPAERCAMIAADRDRARRSSLVTRSAPKHRHSDVMSQSHSGAFPPRPKRFSGASASLMTQSNYETYSSEKGGRARYLPSPRRRPWR